MDPRQGFQRRFQKALAFHQGGDLANAEKGYRQVLSAAPRNFDANYLLGLVYLQTGKFGQAKKQFDRAIKINPKAAPAFNDLGNALLELDRPAEALANYDKATKLDSSFAEAFNNRGNALISLRRFDGAVSSFDRAIAARLDYARAYCNRGNGLRAQERFEEALASYDRAIAIEPGYFDAHNNRGNTLVDLGRPDAALAAYDAAIAANPLLASAFLNRAKALTELRRFADALAACDRALSLSGDRLEGWVGRGDALLNLRRFDESVAAYDKALALDPRSVDAWFGRAMALRNLQRHAAAAQSFEQLLRVAPDRDFVKGDLAHEKMLACDWNGLAALERSIDDDVRAGRKAVRPFGYQALARSAQDLKRCAEIFVAQEFPAAPVPLRDDARYGHERIRLGYLSGEFRRQATSILIAELFELHDKSRFELFAFDNGFDDGSDIRRRINEAFGHVVAIGNMSDAQAADEIKRNEIDILVNLNGYFGAARMGVFSRRPAPIQVNYLGFPRTLGADYLDYILADACVIPPEQTQCYAEKVVYLPDTYQLNDSKRRIAERTPTRAESGLPERGVVFCCFNNNYKITPDVFDVWMRVLKAVDGSVLWLLEDNADAAGHLRQEAEQRGVAPERLVFAPRVDPEDHLARHRLADLFLDTLPYNAHTTASDALWAGLPLLTCLGSAFPGRVAASLLRAAGVPDLIASALDAYQACALRLAREPAELASLKAKLARNRDTCPLFDSRRFTRHIEAAYTTMRQRHERGEPPAHFAVDAL